MKDTDKTTRIAYIIEAGFEYFISLFVTGTFLGYILDALGFSDAMQGIISTVASFTCGAQLFALFLSGKRAKRIVTIGHAINELAFVLLYLLPIFDISSGAKAAILLVLLFSGHIINNAINPAKITWLMTSVPNEKRGSFTAVKEMISLAGGMAVSLGLGRVADIYRDSSGAPTATYYRICCIALFILMTIHTAALLVSTEKPTPERKPVPVKLVVKKLIRNKDLIKVSLVGIIWNVASGLSASFFVSYSREELAFSFTLITVMSMIGSFCRILVSPLVGRIADKKSFSYSMTLCFGVVAVAFLAHTFTMPGPLKWLHLVYLCLHAFAMAGINSGVINLIYDYVVPDERSVALGVKNAIGGILSFFAALIGGAILAKIQANGGMHLFGITVYAQQFLAFLTFIIVILLIVYMRVVIAPLKRVSGDDEKPLEEACESESETATL